MNQLKHICMLVVHQFDKDKDAVLVIASEVRSLMAV